MLQLIRTDSSNGDFQSLVALLDQYLRKLDGDDHAFYAQFNQIDALRNVVVAYLNNQAVSCGAFKPFDEGTVEIKRMFTLPEFRGQRLAVQVLLELEAWASELSHTACVLETGKRMPDAVRLYQRSGYEIISNFGQYAGDENSVCMKKAV
ncbi:MAG: GNAT family N-acetyltransferase [Acidobacteria bacterium]|nr:GNAT family N-acetyltransferase [Acidobacteriota bacterium]